MRIELDLFHVALYVSHLYLGIFFICFLIALARLIYLLVVSKKRWDVKKIVHCMIPVGLLLRALWFGIIIYRYYDTGTLLLVAPLHQQTAISIVVGSLPGYWSISDYLLVCLFWAYLSQGGYSQTSRAIANIRQTYIGINVVVYSIWIALMGLIIYCPCSLKAHSIEALYATVLNFSMGILFGGLGHRTYGSMKKNMTLHASSKEKLLLQRVGFLTTICCVSFILRAAVLSLSFFVWKTASSIFSATCVYLILLEALPEMVILIVMGMRSKAGKNLGKNLNESTPLLSDIRG